MLVLRYAYILALASWLGGMLALGALVAPVTFHILQARDPVAGRALAGDVFGEILRRFHLVAYGAGATLLVTLVIMAVIGPRPAGFKVRLALVAGMLALALYSGIPLTGRLEKLQTEMGVSVTSLPEHDPRRVEFGRLHALSTTLMMINVAGGLALLYWEARR